jgi:hypothetical protein
MTRKTTLALALAIPILVLAALVVRGEAGLRSGRPWVLRMRGYDPRDLLRGHYLSYRIDWGGGGLEERCTVTACCICLRAAPGSPSLVPDASKVSCDETASCDSWFPEDQLDRLREFYIPEGRGPELERALRDRQAELSIRVSPRGGVVVEDMLIDGRPWREAVQHAAP